MIQEIPEQFRPRINTVYPPNNFTEFERWVYEVYSKCDTDRIYLPIFWTGYYVNHSYGQDKDAVNRLQSFIDSLDKSKKYWTIVQYDDSILNDVSELDILRFEMSKNIGVPIPLMCELHPYKFYTPKKYFASFVGSRTHPMRNDLEKFKNKDGWYISFEPHSIEDYCRILHESIFALCPRGYGLNSFRVLEGMQYGAIPVVISDEWVIPSGVNFWEYGVLVRDTVVSEVGNILNGIPEAEVVYKQELLSSVFEAHYTYEGCLKNIIKSLETEYRERKIGENQ
jgi:hypothetical protein